MVAFGQPWPRLSWPLARMTTRCGSTRRPPRMFSLPRYAAVVGPSLPAERAAVDAVVAGLGDLRAGQARSDPLDVDQRLPHPLDGRPHLEGLLELHLTAPPVTGRRPAACRARPACPRPRRRRGRRRATSRTGTLSRRLRAPVVAGHVAQPLEQLALEQHRVAGVAVVGGADRRARRFAGRDHPADRVRRHARLVAERDHHRLAVGQRREPAGERRGLALVPAPAARSARRRAGRPSRRSPRRPRRAPRPRARPAPRVMARSECSSSGTPVELGELLVRRRSGCRRRRRAPGRRSSAHLVDAAGRPGEPAAARGRSAPPPPRP